MRVNILRPEYHKIRKEPRTTLNNQTRSLQYLSNFPTLCECLQAAFQRLLKSLKKHMLSRRSTPMNADQLIFFRSAFNRCLGAPSHALAFFSSLRPLRCPLHCYSIGKSAVRGGRFPCIAATSFSSRWVPARAER